MTILGMALEPPEKVLYHPTYIPVAEMYPMRRVMVQVPEEMYKRLQKEVKDGRWSSMADGMRYYERRGMDASSEK